MRSLFGFTLLALSLGLIGCGKTRTSSSAQSGGTVAPASLCSTEITNIHLELNRKSQAPLTRQSRVSEIVRACQNFESLMSNQSCLYMDSRTRQGLTISFATHQVFCANAERIAKGGQTTPPPPVVVRPNPDQRPPRYDQRNVLLEDLDRRYEIVFQKSFLQPRDRDLRKGNIRCMISIPMQMNGYLRGERAIFVSIPIITSNNRTTYDITAMMVNTGDLTRITCRALSSKLDIESFNDVLEGIVEIRFRNR